MKLQLKNILSIVSLTLLSFTISTSSVAQCKSAVKEGIKKLAPYTHNGQVNNVTLILGEPSEIHLSLYKGLNYKFQIGSENALGKVTFKVLDEDKNEIYNSATSPDPETWVFYSNSTQNLIIEIYAIDKEKQGCAYLVVGMQQPKNNSIKNL
ncbi:MAG: hypothetical protein NTX97_11255 [Bacteroidetes bacterium]|nr:hypothetical protein [Bacteroidota bacterium]